MNIALIFAGGTGQRMNSASSPKQFLNLHGKPILIYTLECFDSNEEIDEIVVVCLDGWIDYLEKKIQQFGISKVSAVIPGGETGFKSIQNGIFYLGERYEKETTVLIHDGVRPLVSDETIGKCVASVAQHGSAITVSPAIETIMTGHGGTVNAILNRSDTLIARAPQCFALGDILNAHRQAESEDREDFIDSASLMTEYGASLHYVEGNIDNIKITTPADFYIFRAMVDAHENAQIFGI